MYDEGWDRYDANVACRELGFETDRAIPTCGAYYGDCEGRADQPILLSHIEYDLISCTTMNNGINDCQHSQDTSITIYTVSMWSV